MEIEIKGSDAIVLKKGSQGDQVSVGYEPDFHIGGPGLTLSRGKSHFKKGITNSLPLTNEFCKADFKIVQ